MKKAFVQQLPTKERLYAVFIKAGISEKKWYDFLLAPNSVFFLTSFPSPPPPPPATFPVWKIATLVNALVTTEK